MFNYLYYKLYQASQKSSLSDIPEFLAPVFLGGLLSANVLVLSALMAKIDLMPFLFSDKIQGGIFALITIIASMFYFREKRYKSILEKYSQESETKRVWGNILVGMYVAKSFLSIFVVAFFRPGKLL